ncbi:hypothetical protein ACEPPN_005735 [Leptodophora sp. 'Broadleaf-Isolate-01']
MGYPSPHFIPSLSDQMQAFRFEDSAQQEENERKKTTREPKELQNISEHQNSGNRKRSFSSVETGSKEDSESLTKRKKYRLLESGGIDWAYLEHQREKSKKPPQNEKPIFGQRTTTSQQERNIDSPGYLEALENQQRKGKRRHDNENADVKRKKGWTTSQQERNMDSPGYLEVLESQQRKGKRRHDNENADVKWKKGWTTSQQERNIDSPGYLEVQKRNHRRLYDNNKDEITSTNSTKSSQQEFDKRTKACQWTSNEPDWSGTGKSALKMDWETGIVDKSIFGLDEYGREPYEDEENGHGSDYDEHPNHEDNCHLQEESGWITRRATRIMKIKSYSHGLAIIEQLMSMYEREFVYFFRPRGSPIELHRIDSIFTVLWEFKEDRYNTESFQEIKKIPVKDLPYIPGLQAQRTESFAAGLGVVEELVHEYAKHMVKHKLTISFINDYLLNSILKTMQAWKKRWQDVMHAENGKKRRLLVS